jgi:hypothetical protein
VEAECQRKYSFEEGVGSKRELMYTNIPVYRDVCEWRVVLLCYRCFHVFCFSIFVFCHSEYL